MEEVGMKGKRRSVLRTELLLQISLLLMLLAAACGPASPEPCPVTLANGQTPPGEQPSPYHHGDGQLFTVLWPQGVIDLNEVNPESLAEDGSISIKFPWWRGEGVNGPLIIEGELVGPGNGSLSAIIPEGYGETGFQASGLIFSQPGCWKVVGRAGQAELEFITQVVEKK